MVGGRMGERNYWWLWMGNGRVDLAGYLEG